MPLYGAPSWEQFFAESIKKIFTPGALGASGTPVPTVIDIGGGLRALKGRGNRYDARRAWIAPLVAAVDYKIMDPVPDYHPDIVGDIHALPFVDNTIDAFICLAVLEHVEDPFRATAEMYRALKPGGACLIYVPFLFYYHAEPGYYKDFWRFTEDGVRHLATRAGFSDCALCRVRGAMETWMHLSPLGRVWGTERLARVIDRITGKHASRQTSGFYALLTK